MPVSNCRAFHSFREVATTDESLVIHALFAAHVLRRVDPRLGELHWVPNNVKSRSSLLIKLSFDCVKRILLLGIESF